MFLSRLKTNLLYITLTVTSILSSEFVLANNHIQFNMDVLDLEDRGNIDLSKFSRPDYIMPGSYSLKIKLNNQSLNEQKIKFYSSPEDENITLACLTPDLTKQLGLKPDIISKLSWWHNGECLNFDSLNGASAKGELGPATLSINIPQAYLEYRAHNWDPASLWDNGVTGLLFDYNINAQTNRPQNQNANNYVATGNGVLGFNYSSWRLRGDWQGRFTHTSQSTTKGNDSSSSMKWSRIYAYRAIPSLDSKFTIGENYLNSNIFDTFRFTGASLSTDLSMLPPNLRGYAPEVTGIAKTSATVLISQGERLIYQTQVPAGPFQIQDLPSGISGQLDVTVEEQDGTVQNFTVNTATIPYLTRPGAVRYSLALGKPSDMDHHTQDDVFVKGEFSWGISNGWSLFGGNLNSENYNALALGAGRDLFSLGAISFDVTQSFARFQDHENTSGSSYRINYSKNFDEYNSQIQFAGYRFSHRNFMSMADYLNAKESGEIIRSSKSMYTISFNKSFTEPRLSTFFNYNRQTYWNNSSLDRYNLMLSRYFDMGSFKNASTSLSVYRNVNNSNKNKNSDGLFLSLSIPLGGQRYVGYSLTTGDHNSINQLNYYDAINEKTSYQVSAGSSRHTSTASAYLTHQADVGKVTANASYMGDNYRSLGFGIKGGVTITSDGADAHPISRLGGTRVLVDTDGVANIPVKGHVSTVTSNVFGKAIIPDINSYYRNQIKVDLNNLPEDAEIIDSVTELSLTDGAIGYRKFNVLSGLKIMIQLKLVDGTSPPFGADIINNRRQETGIVDSDGYAYISGIKPNEVMQVTLGDNNQQCEIHFPNDLEQLAEQKVLLCIPSV